MKNESKFTYPKCPYCKTEYQEHFGDMNYSLLDLATKGWCKEAKVKCNMQAILCRNKVEAI